MSFRSATLQENPRRKKQPVFYETHTHTNTRGRMNTHTHTPPLPPSCTCRHPWRTCRPAVSVRSLLLVLKAQHLPAVAPEGLPKLRGSKQVGRPRAAHAFLLRRVGKNHGYTVYIRLFGMVIT